MRLPKEDRPPREGLRFLLRAAGGLTLIVVLAAAATATAGLLKLDTIVQPPPGAPPPVRSAEITPAKPGKPQTILVLGSDRRWSDLKKNNPALSKSVAARSDTILLIRMDPGQQATAVLSIPRDLKVLIPGYGINKINAAYSLGGPDLTAKTIKSLFGADFTINHIVNVNFQGFRQVVDALGCVYADVDRRYYHSNLGLPVSAHYAEIDVRPGYQELCGQRALDYVRFRHADSDIVRAARQQDFLRAA
ncbi:MAG: polyisoprenyl-teichoic acid--peptidoglycan teichoic acid transferase, partial [Baekduia sp.]|nr:polyisoprenyl-teichoic acid--peptidoglycan teichoic acid transferase [Baekduia sp.]